MELTQQELRILRAALNAQIEDEHSKAFHLAALQSALLRDRVQAELDKLPA